MVQSILDQVAGITTQTTTPAATPTPTQMNLKKNAYDYLGAHFTNENKKLVNTNDQDKNERSADGQQVKYVNQSSKILADAYKYVFYGYMALALISCVVIFLKSGMSLLKQIFLDLAILLFPFYIYPLQNMIYIAFIYLYKLITSNIYSNGFASTQMEYGAADLRKVNPVKIDIPKLEPQLQNLTNPLPGIFNKIGDKFTKAGEKIEIPGKEPFFGLKTEDETAASELQSRLLSTAEESYKTAWVKWQEAEIVAANANSKALDKNLMPDLKKAAEETAKLDQALADVLKAQANNAEKELKKLKNPN